MGTPKEKKEEDIDKEDENENEDADKEDEEEADEEQEIPLEIQQNIDYVDGLMEQFENDEEPVYKQIASMLDRIGGEIGDKIERIDQYLITFSIKTSKRNLLNMFEIYKDDEDNLKKAIIDCLGVDSFNDEIHNKLFGALKGEEQKDKMGSIDEMVKEKENIEEFVINFIKQKEHERLAAEQAAKDKG